MIVRHFKTFRDCTEGEDGSETTLYEQTYALDIEIMSGDWYHDKIDERIEGFFSALDYLGIKYKLEEVTDWGDGDVEVSRVR